MGREREIVLGILSVGPGFWVFVALFSWRDEILVRVTWGRAVPMVTRGLVVPRVTKRQGNRMYYPRLSG